MSKGQPTIALVKKSEAIAWAGGNASELARRLGIRPQSVYGWDEDQIPLLREYQIKEMMRQGRKRKRR